MLDRKGCVIHTRCHSPTKRSVLKNASQNQLSIPAFLRANLPSQAAMGGWLPQALGYYITTYLTIDPLHLPGTDVQIRSLAVGTSPCLRTFAFVQEGHP